MEETNKTVYSSNFKGNRRDPKEGILKLIKKISPNKLQVALLGTLLIFNLLPLSILSMKPKAAEAVSQSDLDKLNNEIGSLNSLLQKKRNEKASLQNEVAIFDAQIKQLDLGIKATDIQIRSTNNDIKKNNEEITKISAELKVHKGVLKEHIAIFYEEGRVSAVEVFASSENFSDYLNKNEYLLTIQGKVRETMDRINILRKQLEIKKTDLDNKNKELSSLKTKQTVQFANINDQKAEKDALLKETAGQEANYAASVEAKRVAFAQVQAELNAILNKPSYVSQGSVKKGDIIGYEGSTGNSTGAHLHWGVYAGSADVDPSSYINSGRISSPMSGAPVVQDYWGSFSHKGMGWPGGWDFAGPFGAPIHAAADGNIITNVNSGPFGHHIIIDHGGGLSTLYAHMQ